MISFFVDLNFVTHVCITIFMMSLKAPIQSARYLNQPKIGVTFYYRWDVSVKYWPFSSTNVTLSVHMTWGGQSFWRHSFLANFLRSVFQNEISSCFSVTKVHNQCHTPKHAGCIEFDTKQLAKKLCFCWYGWCIGINWTNAVLRHKRNRKLYCFSVTLTFFSLVNTKRGIFYVWQTLIVVFSGVAKLHMKILLLVSFSEIKISLILK